VKRREFITLLGGAAVAWPLAAAVKSRAHRIPSTSGLRPPARAGPRRCGRACAKLGYVEGRNIVIEFRWADGVQQLPELAVELVRMNVDVIFAPSSTMVELLL
jgi:putative tryptophan/tyrosine transport system substrate-binding protein